MAINNFQFPGVELRQEFVETPVTGVSTLGVAVVGKKFKSNTTSWIYGGTASTIDLKDIAYCTASGSTDLTVTILDGLFSNFTANSSSTGLEITGSTVAADKKSADVVFSTAISGATAAFGTLIPEVGDTVDISNTTGIITDINGTTVSVDVTGATLSGSSVSTVTFYKVTEAELEGVEVSGDDLVFPATVTAKIGGKSTSSNLAVSDSAYTLRLKYDAETDALALGSVGSMTEIMEQFGDISAFNPMAVAVAFALQAAQGNIVYYVAVKSDNAAGYTEAMDFLDKYDTVYSVVPATYDEDVIKAVIAAAETTSNDVESKVRRSVWYGLETPASNIVNGLVEIRQLIGSSMRSQAVWADGVIYNGEEVPTYAVAAAAAGMRSYEPTYRPISNLGYNFFSLREPSGLTRSDLEKLGSEGIWLVANNFEGTPINKRQVTTAVSNNLNKDEESIVANADSIALTLCHVGENLVGCSNISPALLKSLSDTITALMDTYLINMTGNVYVGPQLLSWSLDSLYQNQVLLDHIYAVITCEPPKPFNRFVMTLRIV